MRERGSELWALRAFRELDDALLDLRFNRPEIGVVVPADARRRRTRPGRGRAPWNGQDDWFVNEVRQHMKRVPEAPGPDRARRSWPSSTRAPASRAR